MARSPQPGLFFGKLGHFPDFGNQANRSGLKSPRSRQSENYVSRIAPADALRLRYIRFHWAWGPDQFKNDVEVEVDHNELMTLTGVKSGHYDIRIAGKGGRVCLVKKADLREGVQFVVRDTDLTECTK